MIVPGSVAPRHGPDGHRRTTTWPAVPVKRGCDCAVSGPARLAQALGLTLDDYGADLLGGGAVVLRASGDVSVDAAVGDPALTEDGLGEPARPRVCSGPRVGVRGPGGDGTAYPWRFWLDGEPTVSVYRPASPLRRRS